jgi:hypothetical protein
MTAPRIRRSTIIGWQEDSKTYTVMSDYPGHIVTYQPFAESVIRQPNGKVHMRIPSACFGKLESPHPRRTTEARRAQLAKARQTKKQKREEK